MLKNKLSHFVGLFSKAKSGAINNYYPRVKNIVFENKKSVIVGAVSLLLTVTVAINLSGHHATLKNEDIGKEGEIYLNDQFQDLTVKLTAIQGKLDGKGSLNVDDLKQSIESLSKELSSVSSHSNEILQNEISSSTNKLTSRLDLITKELDGLKEKEKNVKYLKVKDLPFEVMAINNIQGENVVTIEYNHTVFPINIGDYLAGWRLTSSDFASQKSEFINVKKQHVVIDMNRIEQVKGK